MGVLIQKVDGDKGTIIDDGSRVIYITPNGHVKAEGDHLYFEFGKMYEDNIQFDQLDDPLGQANAQDYVRQLAREFFFDLTSTGGTGPSVGVSSPVKFNRVVFYENFTGDGTTTTFSLSGAIQNATFTTGSWNSSQILTTASIDVVSASPVFSPIYDGIPKFLANKVLANTVDSAGLVTLSHAPRSGVAFSIFYWYNVPDTDEVENYNGTDIVSSMEISASDLAPVATSNDYEDLDNKPVFTPSLVGLGNVDNTSDANKPISTATQTALDDKYDTNNPNSYETPAELNSRDTANRQRSNHTGTQVHTTISDFDSGVRTNRLDQMAVPTTTIDMNGQQLNNLSAPTLPNHAIRLQDIYYAAIQSRLPLMNDQADPDFEPFFIREPLPNVVDGVWNWVVPYTGGDYTLKLSYRCSLNNTGANFLAHIEIDGNFVFPKHIEMKDAAGTGVPAVPLVENSALSGANLNSGTDQFILVYAEYDEFINPTAGQTFGINFEFACQVAGHRATVYDCKIAIERKINQNV